MKVNFGANLWVDTRYMKPKEERELARRLAEETGYPVGYQDVSQYHAEVPTLLGWRNLWPTSYWDQYSFFRHWAKGVLNAKSDHATLLERLGKSTGLRYRVDASLCDNFANNNRPIGFIWNGFIPGDAEESPSSEPDALSPGAHRPILSGEPFNVIEP